MSWNMRIFDYIISATGTNCPFDMMKDVFIITNNKKQFYREKYLMYNKRRCLI